MNGTKGVRVVGKKVMIVESPNKTEKIQSVLGPDWKVVSTAGHLEELASHRVGGIGGVGVDVKNGFRPRHVVRAGRERRIDEIRRETADAKEVWIATDPDREGEAIAYSVSKILQDGIKINRCTFNAITKAEISRAVASPRSIDYDLVRAAHARQVVDRLIGVVLSAKANDALLGGYAKDPHIKYFSVGRVQSPALAKVLDRTREITTFVPEKFCRLSVVYDVFGSVGAASFWLKGQSRKYPSTEVARAAASAMKGGAHKITSVKRKMVKVSPPPPFVTHSMLSSAFSKYGMSADRAMSAAQKLFERGVTTYARTDSPQVSTEGVQLAERHITDEFGRYYFAPRPYSSTEAFTQEAHECLRPADASDLSQSWLKWDWEKVYGMIFERFIAAMMADAVVEETTYRIDTGVDTIEAVGQNLIFDGFWKLTGAPEMREIPKIPEGTVLRRFDIDEAPGETEPPDMHNEATLVGGLVDDGLGRPSTYAQIMETLKERGYVKDTPHDDLLYSRRSRRGSMDEEEQPRRRPRRGLEPTERGEKLTAYLAENHPWVLDKGFTQEIEADLDRIAKGSSDFAKPARKVWKKLEETVPELEAFVPGMGITGLGPGM